MLNLKKILNSNLRNTRWGDVIDVSQNILYNEVKPQILDRIRNKFLLDEINDEEVKDLIFMFGFELTQSDGYTLTSAYLKKQVQTLSKRIKAKTTRKAYLYLFYIYNLLGDVYPFSLQQDNTIEPWLNWFTFAESELENFLTLDQFVGDPLDENYSMDLDSAFDEFGNLTNSENAWELDFFDVKGDLLIHFLLSYQFKFTETLTEFISQDTLRALYNDVLQTKRKQTIPHFRVELLCNTTEINNLAGDSTITEYFSEARDENQVPLITALQESIAKNSKDFTNAEKIQFGKGAHSDISIPLNDVQNLITEFIIIDDFNIDLHISNSFHIWSKSFKNTKFLNNIPFTEIAIIEAVTGNLIFYTKFPKIQFLEIMYSMILLKFDIV